MFLWSIWYWSLWALVFYLDCKLFGAGPGLCWVCQRLATAGAAGKQQRGC